MNKTLKIFGLCSGVAAAIAAYPLYRIHEFQKYYGEAEPLVELVWPLAHESSEFSRAKGRRPFDLTEIDTFSKSHDFTALKRYNPEFINDGPIYFRMRVNKEYSFIIDDAFNPKWDVAKIRK